LEENNQTFITMKKLLFLFVIMIIFSCEKEITEKRICWDCITIMTYPMKAPLRDSVRTCDVLVAVKLDGKKETIKEDYGRGYYGVTECHEVK